MSGEGIFVVSIEFSPLSSVELTNSWYQLHNGDYTGIYDVGESFANNVVCTKNESLSRN